MASNKELFEALRLLEKEKGIPAEYMITQIKKAIVTACRNLYGGNENVEIKMDPEKNAFAVKIIKTVVNKGLMRYIRDFKPDAIVCTHAFAAIALSYLKRKYPIKAKTFAVVTDFTVHPYWEDSDVDYYITASELLNYQMEQKGFSTDKVKPLGIPILSKFANKLSKEDAIKYLGIDDKFTVLVMMGSMGYGSDTFDILKELDSCEQDIQTIIVCGNNKKLKRRVDRFNSRKKIISYGLNN